MKYGLFVLNPWIHQIYSSRIKQQALLIYVSLHGFYETKQAYENNKVGYTII